MLPLRPLAPQEPTKRMEEDQCSLFSWANYYQEGIEELKHTLFYRALELEATVLSAHEEMARKDDELMHLRGVLAKTMEERDVAEAKCQQLVLEKLILQQQQRQMVVKSEDAVSNEDGKSQSGFSSSDSEDAAAPVPEPEQELVGGGRLMSLLKKPLPEKGRFLQAVMEAGPLLQTLLLAGPLPQWQHPPPQLNSGEIPPVTITSPTTRLLHNGDSSPAGAKPGGLVIGKKRTAAPPQKEGGCDPSAAGGKHRKLAVVHQSPLTNINY